METSSALKFAISVFRQPQTLRRSANVAGLDDVLSVVKIAAGDEETLRLKSEETGYDDNFLREACSFLLQQVLLQPGANDHQLLVLTPQGSRQQLKDHKRWLLKWLHPDRNHNVWQQKLFVRVSEAAKRLEAAQELECTPPVLAAVSAPKPRRKPTHAAHRSHVMAAAPIDYRVLTLRWMKQLVICGVLAIVMLVAVTMLHASGILPKKVSTVLQFE